VAPNCRLSEKKDKKPKPTNRKRGGRKMEIQRRVKTHQKGKRTEGQGKRWVTSTGVEGVAKCGEKRGRHNGLWGRQRGTTPLPWGGLPTTKRRGSEKGGGPADASVNQ